MSWSPETAQAERELQRSPAQSVSKSAAEHADAPQTLGGVVDEMAADGSEELNSRLVSEGLLQRKANGELRTQVMRRVQQNAGNHKTQQLVAQLRASNVVQRKCSCGGTCNSCRGVAQRQSSPGSGKGMADASVIPAGSSGAPLDRGTRSFMESKLGGGFGDVRVHTDTRAAHSADMLAADAYTVGRDIYFAAGKYAPSSQEGKHLLAHELTHTQQQGSDAAQAGVATKRSGAGLAISQPGDALEQEADRAADRAMGPEQSVPMPTTGTRAIGGSKLHVQRDPADPAAATGDDPALVAQFNDEMSTWLDNEYADDFYLRVKSFRMVLLLNWNSHPPFRTQNDLDNFMNKWAEPAKTEEGTLNVFTVDVAELALKAFPEGFPLIWGGRVQAALSLGVDSKALLFEYLDELNDLQRKSRSIPPAIHSTGLPVPKDQASRIDHFSLAMGLSSKDGAVRDFARKSLRYVQRKWILSFGFSWERAVSDYADEVKAGKVVINYDDWIDFVTNKQAYLQSLPDRARALPNLFEDVQALQDSTAQLQNSALAVEFIAGLVSIFAGIFGGWKEASALFDAAMDEADKDVRESSDIDRLMMALHWAWDNDYFSAAALDQVRALIDNGPKIIAEMALIILLQFIPGVDIAVDIYLAITMGGDVLQTLFDLKDSLDFVMNKATSVKQLQHGAIRLAEVLVNGGIQILMVFVTEGIAKSAAKIRKGAAELRAADKKLTQAAAEKQVLEGMAASERAPLEKAQGKVEKFDRSLQDRYKPETQPILDTPGVRAKLASISEEARSLLELCDSPCLPPAHQLLEADLKLLEKTQARLGRPGYDRDLKKFFYDRRTAPGGLKQAIEDLSAVKSKDLSKFLEGESKAARVRKVEDAKALLNSGGTFADKALEDRYQAYVARKSTVPGSKIRERADWKIESDFWTTDSPMARGNAFDRSVEQRGLYRYNQVNLEDGLRLNSYVTRGKGEIISRKASDFDIIKSSTFEGYLKELKTKYRSRHENPLQYVPRARRQGVAWQADPRSAKKQ